MTSAKSSRRMPSGEAQALRSAVCETGPSAFWIKAQIRWGASESSGDAKESLKSRRSSLWR